MLGAEIVNLPVRQRAAPEWIGKAPPWTVEQTMTEAMQIVVDLLTAGAAFAGAVTGVWNAYQFKWLRARVDTLETAHNAHVNAPGLHA